MASTPDFQNLTELRNLAFEVLKNSKEENRVISIEDTKEYTMLHLKVRIIKAPFEKYENLLEE